MNKEGKKWLSSIKRKTCKWKKPTMGDSELQERMQRIGVECRVYNVDTEDQDLVKEVAIATLFEDELKRRIIHPFSFDDFLNNSPLNLNRSPWRRFLMFFNLST